MIAFGEYGLGRELAEYMNMNEIWTWLWFNPESYACEIIGFDTVNNKAIIYHSDYIVHLEYGALVSGACQTDLRAFLNKVKNLDYYEALNLAKEYNK